MTGLGVLNEPGARYTSVANLTPSLISIMYVIFAAGAYTKEIVRIVEGIAIKSIKLTALIILGNLFNLLLSYLVINMESERFEIFKP
jgi:hypothetical protein